MHHHRYNWIYTLSRGIISYWISIFQERIESPVKSELNVIQERIADGSDWLICSAECLTNSKWSHDKTCQSELSAIRSWGPPIRSWGPAFHSWGITLAGMFFLTYSNAYRTSINNEWSSFSWDNMDWNISGEVTMKLVDMEDVCKRFVNVKLCITIKTITLGLTILGSF